MGSLGLALLLVLASHRETKILVMGDSISGSKPYYEYKTWADGIAALFGGRAVLLNEAVPGFTTQEMKAAYDAGPKGKVDYCFFMGGVNNFWNSVDVTGAYLAANSLLEEVTANGCRRMVLLRPTPWSSSPYWAPQRQKSLDTLWAGLKAAWCDTDRAQCLDTWLFLGSRDNPSAMEPEFAIWDGLHPNQLGQDMLTFAVHGLITALAGR